VESVYQSSKVFNNKTQLKYLLNFEPLEAKREVNEYQKNNGLYITHFNFFGETISIIPESLFYDYLYIKAIMQDPILSVKLLDYNCFTDIEFNQKTQISSQARSCAIFVFLAQNKLLDRYMKCVEDFRKVYEKIVKSDFNLFSV
jgi:type I restriction enzyme M protein